MRQSQYFLKTSKTKPSEDVSVNAVLLEQGGFVRKTLAGVYTFLPLGLRVLAKIEKIVREEMDAIGAHEMLMPALQPKENWQATGRWTSLDVLFKIKSAHGSEYALGPTHEEIVTPAAAGILDSYKDFPKAVYQLQTKFRDEPRAKSGLLRGREFRMKDLYSFHTSQEDLENFYQKAVLAYKKIFERMELPAMLTEASGGTFSKFSHEFQVEIESGEDTVYVCEKCTLAQNKEIYQPGAKCSQCGSTDFRETKASEIGNIFKLGTKYSEPLNLSFTDSEGKKNFTIMGCYGIGTSRAMGITVEKYHDEKGIVWPKNIAPFAVHLIALSGANKKADDIYESLKTAGVEVLYDDRDISAGAKFADSDLIGIPLRLVVSPKTLEKESVEIKHRSEQESRLEKISALAEVLKKA